MLPLPRDGNTGSSDDDTPWPSNLPQTYPWGGKGSEIHHPVGILLYKNEHWLSIAPLQRRFLIRDVIMQPGRGRPLHVQSSVLVPCWTTVFGFVFSLLRFYLGLPRILKQMGSYRETSVFISFLKGLCWVVSSTDCFVQSGWSGCRTGNRTKLSSSQAQLGQAAYLAVA